ncbi:MAG TPA: DNRLRE domain-containing protein, partial [Actinomycetota bacterium]
MARPAVRPWRLVPFVVIWLLVSNLPRIPSLASPGEPGSTTRSTSRHELTTLRTEDTKFFIEPDGTQVAEVHAGPIHYRAPDGRWLDIDPTLIPSDRDGFAWRNRAGAFSSYFSPTGRASQLVLLQDHDVSVSFALAGMAAASSGTVSADTMTYPDALPGVDLAFKVTRVGVKELIILKRRPLAPLWFRFPLQLSGLSLQTNASGVTALVDAHGNPRYAMPPAWMEDSAVNARSGDGASADVRTDVDSAAGAAVLTLSPDQAWLADPTRVYPVTIDPSINRVVSDDTFVQSNDNSSNVSGLHLRSGTWDGGATKARALFHFDGLVAALAGKDIVDVDFNVFESLSPSCTPSQADLYRVAESWQDDVVWSTQPSVVTPPVASLSAAKGHSADCPADWVTFSSDALTTTVKNWADGTWLNHGFRIRATSETDDNGYKKFYSLENVNDPYLRVAYATASTQPPPPTDGVQLLPPSSLHSNGADIEWTPYASSSGVPFEKYEVHRSTTLGFTPSSGTLLATIDDVSINSYSDTSAAPGKAFTYKVVANSLPSNEQTVTLPPDGQATKVVQPGPEGSQTYLNYSSQLANCINEGAEDTLRVGTDTTEKYRSALQFELTDVPADASVNSATLSLWHPSTVPSQITIDAHQMTSDWDEGAGLGSCTGEGATWQERRSDLDWDSPGGDFDPTQVASLSDPAAEPAGWDAFDVTSLVRDWTAGEASNLGVLLKASDDTSMTSSHYVRYNSDDSTNAALRPKLVINYSEDTHAAAPSVSVTSPVQDERVSGSAVTLAAAASDDRRVERVDFLVDGTQRGSATSEPFAVSWDSTTVPDGTHTIAARATDDAGNTSTSDAVQVRVANTAPPTADFTTPTSGSVVKGNVPVTVRVVADPATTITKVEFYADGYLFATRTAGPMYDASWDTLDPAHPAYDGTHELVAKAYDATGSVTTSPSTQVTVANTAGTPYRADINPAVGAIPQTMDFDPNAESQHSYPVDVTVTNQSADTWLTTQTFLTYSWVDPSDNSVVVDGLTSGIRIPLDTLLAGQSETLHATVAPPPLADGVARSRFILRFDLFKQLIGLPIGIATTQQSSASTGTGTPCCNGPTTFSSQGNPPSDNPVVVNNTLMETAMGLERYYGHDQEDLGAGMTNLVNVSNGNSVLAWRPWSEPGKGLSTVLSISYNSLEDRTESPIGNNFSLSISSLTRFGLPLQVHPPSGNTHPYGYIDLVDADGTPLRFEGTASGTVYKEPPGVHLYLRRFSTTDVNRRWALTRPDGVTFFYDADGYPTEVEDHNQNRLKFALAKPDPGDDPGPPTKHVVQVTDQANRSFDIIYFTHADVADPHIRGKIKRITDHSGHALEFTYYNDGNLLKITEKGGKTADGAVVADRSFVFTYTTSNSAGPAIPNPAERANPNPNTRDQSTQLYSVRDPRRHETTFRYITSGKDNRKLLSRTNRVGSMTSFAYDIYGRITTVTKPLNRITSYAYDTDGKVTSLTDPESRTTWLEWTQDRQVKKVIEPTGKYSAYDYNANGYLLAETD